MAAAWLASSFTFIMALEEESADPGAPLPACSDSGGSTGAGTPGGGRRRSWMRESLVGTAVGMQCLYGVGEPADDGEGGVLHHVIHPR